MVYNWRMGSYTAERKWPGHQLCKRYKKTKKTISTSCTDSPLPIDKQNKKKIWKTKQLFRRLPIVWFPSRCRPTSLLGDRYAFFFSFYVSTCVLLVTTTISRWPSRPQVLFLILLSVCLYYLCYLEKKVDDNWRVAYFFLLSRWRR